jgi:FkbM family methyltransferase
VLVAFRTRLIWLLMRLADHQRMADLRARGWLRGYEWTLGRGQVSVLGGIGVRQRLGAADVPPWGAQAYGVLTGTHEIAVQEALRRSVGPGDTVWDVGANVGAMALIAARIVGPSGRVVAVEPDPGCAAAISRNAAHNEIDWLEVIEAAAADSSGHAELIVVSDRLWTRLASVGEHDLVEQRLRVRTIALDDVAGPPPTLIKIDVEGGELEVLAGMARLLAQERPIVACEMHGKNAAFCDVMQDAGYVVSNLDGPEPVRSAGGNVHALCVPA